MKKKILLSLLVLIVAFSLTAVSAEDLAVDDGEAYQDGEYSGVGDGKAVEVWIDHTEDTSTVYVSGEMKVKDNSNPDSVFVVDLSNSASAKWSTIDSSVISNQTINDALNNAKNALGAKNIRVVSVDKSVVTDEYDNRTYRTSVESGVTVIGDDDYFGGNTGSDYTISHIIEGKYAKIMHVTLNVVAECNYDEAEDALSEPAVNNTQNSTIINAQNSTVSNATSNATDNPVNKTVPNEKNIPKKPKQVEKTGIPFAVLIVAILGLGVSLRQRK